MAANYWASYSSTSLVSQQRLCNAHQEDRARGLTESHIQQLKVYFINRKFCKDTLNLLQQFSKAEIWELSRTCKLRYRVAATASVYFRRFYMRNSFGGPCSDPRLVYVGCLYLASKTEEALLAAKHLVVYVRRLQPNWPYDMKHLLDSEMVIIQELDFMLVVYHPYRPLLQYVADIQAPAQVTQAAWAALNDLYKTDLPLMHPPHILALGCLLYAWTATSSTAHSKHSAEMSVEAAMGTVDPALPSGSAQRSRSRGTGGGAPGDEGTVEGTPGVYHASPAEGTGDQIQATGSGCDRCLAWLLQLNVDFPSVLEVVEQLGATYAIMRPLLNAEECKRLLDISVLPTNTSASSSQQSPIA